MILDEIIDITDNYLNSINKKERKKIGQFFTSKETALFMANLSKCKKRSIRILDAGAGTGILSIALLEKLNKIDEIESIEIDLYENDNKIINILDSNMRKAQEVLKKIIHYNIINKNFIVFNKNSETPIYDIVVSNPPYKKIGKNDIESTVMQDVVYGQPNLYFLFMEMSERLLKKDGELICIVPRSWTSGTYFKKFRQKFLDNTKITNMHLFVSRDEVFNKENVLQETMIIRAIKSDVKLKEIQITQSFSNNDFDKIKSYLINYDTCIKNDDERYVYLPVDDQDINVLEIVNNFNTKLKDIGLKLKTGLTVDFRNEEFLEKNATSENVPLLSSIHFKNGLISFPSNQDEAQYVTKDNSALLQKNTNYLFIKRFSSKEENRRIQPAMFFKNELDNYDYISTENHINFITCLNNSELDKNMVYGLYVIYNSSLYDKYYRILNGSTQVNATEINNIPIPSENLIIELGKRIRENGNITTEVCDNILMEAINNG